jgi:hypothetical protein
MYLWKCKYCECKFTQIKRCVLHELIECDRNPKFKYRIQSEINDSYNDHK